MIGSWLEGKKKGGCQKNRPHKRERRNPFGNHVLAGEKGGGGKKEKRR